MEQVNTANKNLAPESAQPKKRLKLDPDLADGCHWTIADNAEQVTESLQLWMDEAAPGDSISIKLVKTTDDEVAELPAL